MSRGVAPTSRTSRWTAWTSTKRTAMRSVLPRPTVTVPNAEKGPVLRLNSEAIEEFRVATLNSGAGGGRSSGAQIASGDQDGLRTAGMVLPSSPIETRSSRPMTGLTTMQALLAPR